MSAAFICPKVVPQIRRGLTPSEVVPQNRRGLTPPGVSDKYDTGVVKKVPGIPVNRKKTADPPGPLP